MELCANAFLEARVEAQEAAEAASVGLHAVFCAPCAVRYALIVSTTVEGVRSIDVDAAAAMVFWRRKRKNATIIIIVAIKMCPILLPSPEFYLQLARAAGHTANPYGVVKFEIMIKRHSIETVGDYASPC